MESCFFLLSSPIWCVEKDVMSDWNLGCLCCQERVINMSRIYTNEHRILVSTHKKGFMG